MVPKTSCSWMPAIFAASTRLLIRSPRRCSCVSTPDHFAFTFSRFVVSVLYPQPLAASEITITAKRSANLRVFILNLPFVSYAHQPLGLLPSRDRACGPARQLLQQPARSETCRPQKFRGPIFQTWGDDYR